MKNDSNLNRRKFVKLSVLATTAVGVSALGINYGIQSARAKATTNGIKTDLKDTRDIFKKCGACSHTFCYLIDREFGNSKEHEERATGPLAGGLMMGHQCGMLWGSALAVGTEAYRRNNDQGQAVASAITATRQVMESFAGETKSVNCCDVSPVDFTKKAGMAKFLLLVLINGGMKNTACFDLAEKWAPEAIRSAKTGLSVKQTGMLQNPVSCASEVIKKMGGSDEEIVMVSGFAGGMGLKGHACGALAAAVWMNTLAWCRKNPGKMPPLFSPKKSGLLNAFYETTHSEIICQKITGQSFKSIEDHTEFIKNGGCSKIIDTLAKTI